MGEIKEWIAKQVFLNERLHERFKRKYAPSW